MLVNATIPMFAVLFAFLQSPQERPSGSLQLDLKPVMQTALAGIPVVVKLQYTNSSKTDVDVYVLEDPYLDFVLWRWESKEADPYEVSVWDLHCAIPRPGLPKRVTLKSGEQRAWYFNVPTPRAFGSDSKWTLTASVMNLDKRGELQRASTTIIGRDPQTRAVLDALGPTRAQAGLLVWTGRSMIASLQHEKKMSVVEGCSRKGDRAAELILFARSVVEKKDTVRHFKSLEDAPEEIKCLRNYLLFRPLEWEHGIITEGEAEAIRTSLSPKSPLGAELLERIERRSR